MASKEELTATIRAWFGMLDEEYDTCAFHIFGEREQGVALISWPGNDPLSIAWIAQWSGYGHGDLVQYDVSMRLDFLSPDWLYVSLR